METEQLTNTGSTSREDDTYETKWTWLFFFVFLSLTGATVAILSMQGNPFKLEPACSAMWTVMAIAAAVQFAWGLFIFSFLRVRKDGPLRFLEFVLFGINRECDSPGTPMTLGMLTLATVGLIVASLYTSLSEGMLEPECKPTLLWGTVAYGALYSVLLLCFAIAPIVDDADVFHAVFQDRCEWCECRKRRRQAARDEYVKKRQKEIASSSGPVTSSS
uniref:Uncharacterized protein n=1 Tax=Chromera velia CCMP2878 TaxID=1169474 RepID=A0A0G4FPC7_9ALVE|mmetsp:Transcript_26046/g.51100  ORF Transcript_26046/g.51100 Transcript_26046/m.51100 type:complete len:218 (+) Transcript_26046:378-1031(+)|eukprot:Cvel_3588.t1-p1 / transcript=Cvel_3588.t1 / gene=Cvel_3588 / organism=Chromera_velia_CCMP2878 / gene_product=hypothetical protein / transcript_product=hypothetical protein / location=Cvel_scaffold147:3649-6419(+) / protein_length=217 / sequence_SO=supercontig / SO=protein_coding / is_pseudo=false